MSLFVGVDVGVSGDKTAVVIAEKRNGTLFIHGNGVGDSVRLAYDIALQSWLRTAPWWRRWFLALRVAFAGWICDGREM